jgi:hypothetical protein
LAGASPQSIIFRISPAIDCPRVAKQEADLEADLEEALKDST